MGPARADGRARLVNANQVAHKPGQEATQRQDADPALLEGARGPGLSSYQCVNPRAV
jgi:hypothetical protein